MFLQNSIPCGDHPKLPAHPKGGREHLGWPSGFCEHLLEADSHLRGHGEQMGLDSIYNEGSPWQKGVI